MSTIPVYDKDPDSIEVFTINWAFRLGTGVTISASSWTVEGVTSVSDDNTDTTASVKLSGGTLGETHRCTNRITTSGGETLEQSIDLYMTEK